MALRFRVLAEADQEVDDAAAYYELQSPGTGRRFLRSYFELIAHLQQFPRAGTLLPDYDEPGIEVRSFIVSTVFPYTVFAAVMQDEFGTPPVSWTFREARRRARNELRWLDENEECSMMCSRPTRFACARRAGVRLHRWRRTST